MPPRAKDPTEPIRLKAGQYAGVDKGAACTQSSFKVGGKAFLFVGEQGGRSKVMLKLDASMAEARKLAKQAPDDYQVGTTGWVTARFDATRPMPKRLWERWLEESYAMSAGGAKKKVTKKKTASKKKTTRKKPAARRTTVAKKKTTKKKTTRRR